MKCVAVVVAAALVVVTIMAPICLSSPIPEASPREHEPEVADGTAAVATTEERADRHVRATCDLLSFDTPWIKVNHSACAAHCLAMRKGYKGGYCQNAVCHCRK